MQPNTSTAPRNGGRTGLWGRATWPDAAQALRGTRRTQPSSASAPRRRQLPQWRSTGPRLVQRLAGDRGGRAAGFGAWRRRRPRACFGAGPSPAAACGPRGEALPSAAKTVETQGKGGAVPSGGRRLVDRGSPRPSAPGRPAAISALHLQGPPRKYGPLLSRVRGANTRRKLSGWTQRGRTQLPVCRSAVVQCRHNAPLHYDERTHRVRPYQPSRQPTSSALASLRRDPPGLRTAKKGAVLAASAVELTRQRQCLRQCEEVATQGKGSVLVATQGKSGVLVETHGKCSVLPWPVGAQLAARRRGWSRWRRYAGAIG